MIQWHLKNQLGALPGNIRTKSYDAPVRAGWRLPYSLSAIGEGYLVQVTLRSASFMEVYFLGNQSCQLYTKDEARRWLQCLFPIKQRADLLFAMNLVTSQGTLKHIKAKPGIKVLGGKTGSGTLVNKKFQTNGWAVIGFFAIIRKLHVLTAFVSRGQVPAKQQRLRKLHWILFSLILFTLNPLFAKSLIKVQVAAKYPIKRLIISGQGLKVNNTAIPDQVIRLEVAGARLDSSAFHCEKACTVSGKHNRIRLEWSFKQKRYNRVYAGK